MVAIRAIFYHQLVKEGTESKQRNKRIQEKRTTKVIILWNRAENERDREKESTMESSREREQENERDM